MGKDGENRRCSPQSFKYFKTGEVINTWKGDWKLRKRGWKGQEHGIQLWLNWYKMSTKYFFSFYWFSMDLSTYFSFPFLRNKNQLLNEVCRSLAIVIRNHACQCVHARVPCEPYHDQYHSDKHVKITVNNLAKFWECLVELLCRRSLIKPCGTPERAKCISSSTYRHHLLPYCSIKTRQSIKFVNFKTISSC